MNKDALYSHNWNEKEIEEAKKLIGPILIVGASGFIGSKFFFNLSRYRDDVYACSRNAKQSWRLSAAESSRLINLDILNFDSLKNAIGRLKPQTIFNLSAYGAYSRQTDTEKIHQTNYIGTLNLIRALMETGCSAFVQAGTSSEYGLNCAGPDENDTLSPNSDYAVSKVGASYLVKYYGTILNFPCVNLRLYSVYGPWEERDRLIPTLISNGLQGKYPNLVNKDISRDFVYVDDCLNAFVKAALNACKTNPGISLNIASGIKTTLENVAKTAQKIFGIQNEPVFGSMANRKWDLVDWYGNPDFAEKIMGWKYKTSFEEGLRSNVEWEKVAAEKLKHVYIPSKNKMVSAIVACYKDNLSIPILHKRLTEAFTKTGYDYEIIFVNDASPNNDEEVIANLCAGDSHVIGISHSRNFGSQSAFLSGMEISSGDAVVFMDGDGQDPPEIIPKFIKKWEEGYDIVYGKRVKREAPFYMQIFYKLFYRIFKKLSDIKIPVDAGDFSLVDRKASEYLMKFTEKDVFLRGLRAWVGFKQTGVSYLRPERLFGKSTNNFWKNIWWAKKGIFSFSTKPLQYIQSIGVFVFLVTVGLGVFYLVDYFLHPPTDARGITTIILLVLGIGSIQLISTSILGDYIGKITEEVKSRPRFIRNKILYNGKIYSSSEDISKLINEIKSI
ncbi:MAG: NAD-dependent epimerase/dehydratase family protein [Candidatus Moranbacteria bacterium]|nr:NAD-dependent epimerase/dehydratase family protein [Candidatus Moranbacteria bacterium]